MIHTVEADGGERLNKKFTSEIHVMKCAIGTKYVRLLLLRHVLYNKLDISTGGIACGYYSEETLNNPTDARTIRERCGGRILFDVWKSLSWLHDHQVRRE